MSEKLRQQLDSVTTSREEVKRNISVRLFGPYAGDCSEILDKAACYLREESDIRARLCMNLPDSRELDSLSNQVTDDIYNFESSIECLNTADYAVFLFLKAREERFEGYQPQDLNASNALEFEKWIDMGIPNPSHCIVIYEDKDVKKGIGSLIRGIRKKGAVRTECLNLDPDENTAREIAETIKGDFEPWLSESESSFLMEL